MAGTSLQSSTSPSRFSGRNSGGRRRSKTNSVCGWRPRSDWWRKETLPADRRSDSCSSRRPASSSSSWLTRNGRSLYLLPYRSAHQLRENIQRQGSSCVSKFLLRSCLVDYYFNRCRYSYRSFYNYTVDKLVNCQMRNCHIFIKFFHKYLTVIFILSSAFLYYMLTSPGTSTAFLGLGHTVL